MESTNQTKQTEESTILESETYFLTYRCPKCYFIPKISLITNAKNEKEKIIRITNDTFKPKIILKPKDVNI